MLQGIDPRQKQVMIMVLLDWMSFVMTILVFPVLLLNEVFSGQEALTSYTNGLIGGLQVVLMFLFGPLWGTLSDKYGRKPFLVLCVASSAAYYGLNTLAFTVFGNHSAHTAALSAVNGTGNATFPASGALLSASGTQVVHFSLSSMGPGFYLVIFAAIIKVGFFFCVAHFFAQLLKQGLFFMTMTFENATVVDVNAPADRGTGLALNGAMMGIGLIVGSLISYRFGYMLDHAFSFVVATFASILMLLGLAFFRESLRREDRKPFKWTEANPFLSLHWLLSTPLAWIPVSMYWLVNLIGSAFMASWILWSREKVGGMVLSLPHGKGSHVCFSFGQFGLDTMSQSLCIFDAGLASIITQTAGMYFLMPRIGERAIIIGAVVLKGIVCMGMVSFFSFLWVFLNAFLTTRVSIARL